MASDRHPQLDLLVSNVDEMLGDDLKPIALAKVAAMQCLTTSTQDTNLYVIAVNNFEATMDSKIDDYYRQKIEEKEKEIAGQGKVYQDNLGRAELAMFKFRQLIRLIDRKSIHEKEGLRI